MKYSNFIRKLNFAVLIVTAVLFVGCASASKKEKNAELLIVNPAIKTGDFGNGMNYYILKNSEPKNRILLRLVVNAGSCMEEEDQKGVAHFIEHLAFNGTEHFEKQAIVDYFEKIGMNFGADLNAYTSFEQTVYMLEIPADNPEILETAILILHDWACAVTFPLEEIEKERGVVTEEWRLGQGFRGRITNTMIPFILKDSAYSERLPIGDMDVIKNVSRERILDFYKKWYRPDLMSVVVVGDAEVSDIESALKKTMCTIPTSKDKLKRPEFAVPAQKDKSILIMKDAEQNSTEIDIFKLNENYKPVKTKDEYKRLMARVIGQTVLNQRISEIANTPEAKWFYGGMGSSSFSNGANFDVLTLAPKDGQFEECLKAFFDECDRISTFGVTAPEVERIRQYYFSQADLILNNKDTTPSSEFASDIIQYCTEGEIPFESEYYSELLRETINAITIEEINAALKKELSERMNLMFILASDKVQDLPDEQQIMDIWKNYKNQEIAAYEDDADGKDIMERPAKIGTVVSKKEIPEVGANEYMLSNGIRVITKKTDFEKDYVYINISSKGGSYLVKDDEVPGVGSCLSYALYSGFDGMTFNQLRKKIVDKNISLSFNVSTTQEKFYGGCRPADVDAFLQIIHLFMVKPQFTQEGWAVTYSALENSAKGFGLSPDDLFYAKVNEFLYGDDIRFTPFDMDYLAKMTPELSEKVYRERFANPADFTYVFVGDFDEDSLIESCCAFVGSMPTTDKKEETVYKYHNFPKGIQNAVVNKGQDEQGRVYIGFGGSLPAQKDAELAYKEDIIINYLEDLLDIRLREIIREDKSGSYGISVNCGIDGYPERFHRSSINFGCEPKREQELVDEVINQIKIIQNEPISPEYIEKIRESVRRNRETNLRNNNWWMNRLVYSLVFDYEPLWVSGNVEKSIEWITAENIQAAAKKYLDTSNYFTVFLKPENK